MSTMYLDHLYPNLLSILPTYVLNATLPTCIALTFQNFVTH